MTETMTVSMLDCIKRVPERLDWILSNRERTFSALRGEAKARVEKADEIVMIGSGTSNTSALTARFAAEKGAKIRVTAILPTDFLYHMSVYNPNALYVFTSQTGTSAMVRVAIAKAKKIGGFTIAVSESADTPAAKEADLFIDMGCGKEEYGMRTIGYSTSVLTLALLGMEVGRIGGRLPQAEFEEYLAQARAAVAATPEIIRKAERWMDTDRRNMLRSDCLVFTGTGALAGVAMEAAVKVWETPQITALGCELEDGMHGPNYGYSQRHCVIVLNDGGVENDKALALCRYMKGEMNNGFLIGANPVDEHDLAFDPAGGILSCLEFASAIQVVAYRLAVDQGRDLFHRSHGNMGKYFSSHRALSPEELKL
ncbi:MAG: SIS domain-containing protein [Clostridia bacterium]|nr:SIS domain-containing protein [Clostridia bacterium]